MFFKCVLVLCLCVTAVHMQRRVQLYSTDPNHGPPHHGSNEDEHIQFVRPSHDHQSNHFTHDTKINTRQTLPDQMTFFELLGRLVAEYLQRRGAIPGISSSANHNHNNNNFVSPQQPPYIQNPCYIHGAWRNCDSYQPPTSSGFDEPIFTQQSFQNLPPVRPQQPNRPQQLIPSDNVSPRPVNNRPDNVSPYDESFNDIFNTTNAMSKKEKELVKNLAFSSVFFQGITPDNPDPQNVKECTEEPGISIKKTVEWFLDNSDTDSLLERRCEFACIFEKMGILKDNSVLNKGFLRLTHELYKDLPSFRIISYMNRVLQCLDSLGNYGDRCATGAKLLICGFMKQTNYAGCMRGFTLINGARQCAGETLFEDDFDSELEKFKWKPSVKISSVEDEEFVVYNQAPENIRIEDGKLIIQPTIMHDDMVQQGTLNLRKCTGYYGSPECFKKAESYNILPPVLSAQITSKFYFKYGRVEIRAKLPEGDWIVPQLWLIPKNKEFGPLYNSGRVLIAKCNGNPQLLSPEGIDISARHLRMGTMLGVERDVRDRFGEEILPAGWHDHFHNFTLLWEPDGMSFFVDGILTKQIGKNDREPLVDSLRFSREDIASTWPNRTRMTPFDDEFRVRFGVSVGGNMDFPDNSVTGKNHTKPWINKGSVKYLLNFWRDRQNWLSTWKSNRTALEIDYIRVNALL